LCEEGREGERGEYEPDPHVEADERIAVPFAQTWPSDG
jgi:hypothetical protein